MFQAELWGFDVTCAELREALSGFLDDELSPAEDAEVRAHLAECTACADRLETLERGTKFVRTLEDVKPRPDFLERLDARLAIELEADGFVLRRSARLRPQPQGRVRRNLYRAAAALLIGAGAYASYALWTRPER